MEGRKSILEVSNSALNEVLKSSVWPLVFAASITIFLSFFNIIFSMIAIIIFSLGYILISLILLKYIPFNSKLIINGDKILVLIHDNKFMELDWNEITEIIFFIEKYQIASIRYRFRTSDQGFSLKFEGKESSKTLRLWCLAFRSKHQKRILKEIREVSKTYGIEVKEGNSSPSTILLRDQPCSKYRKFTQP